MLLLNYHFQKYNLIHLLNLCIQNLFQILEQKMGYNYKMGPINAAIGLSKIHKLVIEINQRRSCFERYHKLLDQHGFQFQIEAPDQFSNRWLSVACLDIELNVGVISKILDSQGIETRRAWNPMHKQPLFQSHPYYSKFNVSDMLFSRCICLPFCSDTTIFEIEKWVGYNS